MRISGIASGMDTETMVGDLMRVERIPVDRVFQQKVQAEWKRDAYREVNTTLLRLRNAAFDLSLQGAFLGKSASSTHENLLVATAGASSETGTFYFKVQELAASAQFQSSPDLSVADAFGEYLNSLEEDAYFELRGLDGEMEKITVSQQDTLEEVLKKINQNKNLGLNTYHDQYTDRVAISTAATGESAVIEVGEDASGFFATVFGEDVAASPVLAQGTNARLEINGLATERETNTFEIAGTTITLKEAGDAVIRVDVEQDTDLAVEKIKDFVTLYNEIIADLNSALREENHRDYLPLTADQRAEMSEKEIELWEERAKSGLLRSDKVISGILAEMRQVIGGDVKGLDGTKSLFQMGIKTGSWYEHGQLHVDEDKLRQALEDDLEGVMEVFTKSGATRGEEGIARRLTGILDEKMERIVSTAGKATIPYDQSHLGRQIRDFESRLGAMEERLVRLEQNYWDKFTVMERMLGQLYSQSDWLYQQLASLQGW